MNTPITDLSLTSTPPTQSKAVATRDAAGHWMKGVSGNKGNSTSKGQNLANWFSSALERFDPDDPKSEPKLIKLFNRMVAIATNDESGHMKEAVWAAGLLLERAYGKPVRDSSELDAMKSAGIKIQIVQLPALPASQPGSPAGQQKVIDIKPEFEDT